MRNNHESMDSLLKRTLTSEEKPHSDLIDLVKLKLTEEEPIVKRKPMKYSFGAIVTAALLMLVTTTAFAAWLYLKPSEVAEKFENNTLSTAFNSETAININESVVSGDYIFTLLAVVSGKDITDMPYTSEAVQEERIYAVLAIQNTDGTAMPDTKDDNYGETSFFATPLVKGLIPWQINAASLNGGYSDMVEDGIMYRLVECDSMTMFADRGLYFAVSTSSFYDVEAFNYNEEAGEITVNPDYKGACAIFELPIDKTLAEPEKAEAFLESFYAPPEDPEVDDEFDLWGEVDWENAKILESTVRELTVDEDGMINFAYDCEYGSGKISTNFEEYFDLTKGAQSLDLSQMGSDDEVCRFRVTIDENGTIRGMIVIPEK